MLHCYQPHVSPFALTASSDYLSVSFQLLLYHMKPVRHHIFGFQNSKIFLVSRTQVLIDIILDPDVT